MGLSTDLPGRVQVAGVIDQAEAELIIEAGADMLGFPLGLEDGREDLGIEEAAAIIRNLPGEVTAVCITYLGKAGEVARLCDRLGVRWVQLHGEIALAELAALRARDPGLGIIKSVIIRPGDRESPLRAVQALEPHVDAFITDTFDPETQRRGATGKTHDWDVSASVVSRSSIPVILAGGLTPGNVAEAIAAVHPAAVDAHTGIEGADGRKDPAFLVRFVQTAGAAYAALPR